MARTKGTFNISANIETNASAPLDARERVVTKNDLTASGSFPYFYEGMMVYVVSEQKRYTLKGSDPTVLSNWEENGSGGGGSVTIDDELSDSSTNPVQNKVIKGGLDGKADLVDGKIPANQLPSYVDDVIQGYLYNGVFYEDAQHTEPITGENGKIYIDLTTNKTYRWNGTGYSEISESLALGETSSTAYRGDRGKTAYDDSQTNKTNIGNLSSLLTTVKTSLVNAINELVNGKQKNLTAGDGITLTTGSSADTVAVDAMPSTDMSEIIDPLPGCTPKWMNYSEEEQAVGTWIDGKTIYQKTLVDTMPTVSTSGTVVSKDISIGAQVDSVVSCDFIAYSTSGYAVSYPCSLSYASQKLYYTRCIIKTNGHTSPNAITLNSSDTNYSGSKVVITLRYTKV